jgi:malate dehydrogenase
LRAKVTIAGAGQTGGSIARRVAERGYADVVMVDIVEGFAAGKALDLNQAGSLAAYLPNLVGSNGFDGSENSDICVITSGFPRQPGMSRDDLLLKNKEIVEDVAKQLAIKSPNCKFIVLTNPVDAMAQLVQSVTSFPKERVIGQGGILDTARYRTFIAWELGVSPEDVSGFVLGGHGDAMVPVPRYTAVAGVPVGELLPEDRIESIVQRTRGGGAEIVKLLQRGSAYEAPGEAVTLMIDAILLNQKRLFPCSVLLEGEYGVKDTFVGVLVKLGADGYEQLIELSLTDDELAALHKSAAGVRELVEIMGV